MSNTKSHIWTINVSALADERGLNGFRLRIPFSDRELIDTTLPIPTVMELVIGKRPHVIRDNSWWRSALHILTGADTKDARFIVYDTENDDMIHSSETEEVTAEDVRVKVIAHRDHLVIFANKPEKDKNFIPPGEGRIGCVLIDTESLLGMSNEAWRVIQQIPTGRDAIGDISLWEAEGGRGCFGWLGGVKRLIDPKEAELDRNGPVNIPRVTIPNELDPEIKDDINAFLDNLEGVGS